MKLVEFKETKRRNIYINPQKVKLVRPHSDTVTMIYMEDGGAVAVIHSIDEVVRKLQEKDIF